MISISTIQKYCDGLIKQFDTIPAKRKQILNKLAHYIAHKTKENKPVNLIYICTHNSRRSVFGQIWGHVAAKYYKVNNVHTYSGGTEATAFNINAINALKRLGFIVKTINGGENPVYHVIFDQAEKPIACFSKVYDHSANPRKEFVAIMTCGDAEENCPFIPGAELKIATTYDDPKAFDNTPLQEVQYDERCHQIALETLYVFSRL